MLDEVRARYDVYDRVVPEPRELSSTFDLDAILAAARRQAWVVAAAVAAFTVLGALYLATATRIYTASVDILIDSRNFGATEVDAPPSEQAQLIFNASAIDSQVEVLKSENIALAVIEKFDLTANSEFAGRSMIGRILAWLPFGRSGPDEADRSAIDLQKALGTFERRLKVMRVGKTFVINVKFSSRDPQLAADVTNALADQYLVDQLDAKYDATQQASDWLLGRVQELQDKSMESELAVQRFREDNNLITADGRLINDQQLADLNAQLTSARSDRLRAQARYDRIKSIIDNGELESEISDALDNPIIVQLRNRYLDVAKRKRELEERVGPGHEQVIKLDKEMEGFRQQLFQEMGRIAEGYRSDLQIAQAREQSVVDTLSGLMNASAEDNRTLVTLREMQQKSDSYRVLYQDFLDRYQKLVQQQSFPVTDARIITRAIRPIKPSQPRGLMVAAISLVGGLCVGTGLGMLREYRDGTFRTGEQLRYEADVEFLGVIPLQSRKGGNGTPMTRSEELALMRTSVTKPLSQLADTLRTAKVALDLEQGPGRPRVIGVVSAASGEGKTVVASNLAMLLGNMGFPTLLIDGDFRHCGISRAFDCDASNSLMDVVAHNAPLADVVQNAVGSKVWILPAPPANSVADSSLILGSPAMKTLIGNAATYFDYVVIDLPPMGALVDARAAAQYVENFLLVVEWGKTPRRLLRDTLLHNAPVRGKCIGAVLNKADPSRLTSYVQSGPHSYGYSSG